MKQSGAINRQLETLAHDAALSLGVPFVTITVGDDAEPASSLVAKAVFADSGWSAEHQDVDLVALDNSRAVAHNIPFYACVPVRGGEGESLGRVCCGSSEERGLTDADLDQLKQTAEAVAELVKAHDASAQFVRV